MKTGKPGIDLIKQFEGYSGTAYICPAGIVTIGYGHTKTAKIGMVITAIQAEALLKSDLADAERAVNYCIFPFTQNQFDALVSFTYNVGAGNLATSTLLKKIKAKASNEEITAQFQRWVYGKNKKRLPGLEKRRTAEANLYCKIK